MVHSECFDVFSSWFRDFCRTSFFGCESLVSPLTTMYNWCVACHKLVSNSGWTGQPDITRRLLQGCVILDEREIRSWMSTFRFLNWNEHLSVILNYQKESINSISFMSCDWSSRNTQSILDSVRGCKSGTHQLTLVGNAHRRKFKDCAWVYFLSSWEESFC